MESEEDRLIKEQLIKEQMGVDDIELDGKLIQKILEAPKQAQYEINFAFVKKSFFSLDKNVNKAIAKSTSSHHTFSKRSKDFLHQPKTYQFSDAVTQ